VIGYDKVAKDYDKGRRDYPKEAISILVSVLDLQPKVKVLDLAAGTGKLTKALQSLDLDLCAVEPVAEMRAIFTHHFPNIPILQGIAEAIPLPTASVDVVVVGTAFHWFEGDKALAEIARVLKPRGKLGLIWNVHASEISWVRDVWQVLEKYEKSITHNAMQWRSAFERTKYFGPLGHQTHSYSFLGGSQDVLNRLFSAKLMGKLTHEKREKIVQEILAVLADHPSTKDKTTFEIPYRVELYWCQKSQ
jgi:ubiquinone/menaquinone biosynthesis C-methylase UbiE